MRLSDCWSVERSRFWSCSRVKLNCFGGFRTRRQVSLTKISRGGWLRGTLPSTTFRNGIQAGSPKKAASSSTAFTTRATIYFFSMRTITGSRDGISIHDSSTFPNSFGAISGRRNCRIFGSRLLLAAGILDSTASASSPSRNVNMITNFAFTCPS